MSYKESEGREVLRAIYANPTAPIGVDTETTGLKVTTGEEYCIGASVATVIDGKPYSHYFGIDHPTGENIDDTTFDMLAHVLKQPRLLIFANPIFDIHSFETVGIDLIDSDFIDICTMAHLVDENQPFSKSLDALSAHYLGGEGKVKDPFVEDEKKTGNQNITPEQMFEYGKVDAELAYRVWALLVEHSEWTNLPENIWPEKQKLIRVLAAMKKRGVAVDLTLASEMEALGAAEMDRLREELGMNPNSNADMAELFIDKLELPVLKTSSKTGKPSFAKAQMAEYDVMLEALDNPIAKTIKAYRGWSKSVTAAYRPYLRYADPDGRVRCSYKPHGTVTGRFSCSEPNLQQIPKTSDKEWNGKVKECFIARPGYTLVEFDYSQLELRIAAGYAKEDKLLEVFNSDRDIFDEMSQTLGWTRDQTKTFVYMTQYGGGIGLIAVVFGVSYDEAKLIYQSYFDTYPGFRRLSERVKMAAEKYGRIKIWSGRYRRFRFPRNDSYKALNSMIQGGGADVMERTMVRLFDEVDVEDECMMLLQVHDSLAFEIRNESVEAFSEKIIAIMEDVEGTTGLDFGVKFHVESKIWSEG